MMSILEDVFKNMLKKKYGTADNFDIVINTDKGDLEAFRNRLIVDDGAVEDPSTQIEYSEAILIEPDFEVGEEVSEKVRFTDFGRRAVLAARQNLMARVQELEKRASSRSTRTAWVRSSPAKCTRSGKRNAGDGRRRQRVDPAEVGTDPGRLFQKGDAVRAVVLRVEMINGTPKIVLSRTSPSSSKNCSNSKYRKYSTGSSRSRRSCASRASAPRWPLKATTTASIRWAPASV